MLAVVRLAEEVCPMPKVIPEFPAVLPVVLDLAVVLLWPEPVTPVV